MSIKHHHHHHQKMLMWTMLRIKVEFSQTYRVKFKRVWSLSWGQTCKTVACFFLFQRWFEVKCGLKTDVSGLRGKWTLRPWYQCEEFNSHKRQGLSHWEHLRLAVLSRCHTPPYRLRVSASLNNEHKHSPDLGRFFNCDWYFRSQ